MISNLNIKVDLHQDTKGRISFRISGNTATGGRFGKELQFPEEGCTLEQFEEFLLETKYEALYPPHFNIPPSEPHPKWADLPEGMVKSGRITSDESFLKYLSIIPDALDARAKEVRVWRPEFEVQENVGLEFPGIHFSDFSLSLKPKNFSIPNNELTLLQPHDRLRLSTDFMQVIVIKGILADGMYNVGYVTRNKDAYIDPDKLSKGSVWEMIHFPAGEPVKRFLSSEKD